MQRVFVVNKLKGEGEYPGFIGTRRNPHLFSTAEQFRHISQILLNNKFA